MPRELKLLFARVILGTLAIAGLTAPSPAAMYHASGAVGATVDGQNQLPYDSYSLDLGVQAGGEATYNVFGPNMTSTHAQASSIAEGLGLHAHTSAEYIVIPPAYGVYNSYILSSRSTAWLVFEDVVFSGPAGGTTSTSLNLRLDGSHFGSVSVDPGGRAFTSSGVNVQVSVNGVGIGDGLHQVDVRYDTTTINTIAQGMLANGLGDFVTPSFNVPVGVPFSVKLQLDTQASVIANFSTFFGMAAAANTDFSHTLSFAPTGPVFNLAAGYTANSAEGHIVDNQFVVPEPSSLILAACSFVGLATGGLRRRG